MTAQLTVRGLTQADAELRAMARRVRDHSPATRLGAAELATLIDDCFALSRAPDGTPFAALKPATIAKRRKGSSTPLVDTARYRRSVSVVGGPRSIRFGTNVAYAIFHQAGTRFIAIRAVFPVELVGGRWQLIDRGPAAEAFRRIRGYIENYVATGDPARSR